MKGVVWLTPCISKFEIIDARGFGYCIISLYTSFIPQRLPSIKNMNTASIQAYSPDVVEIC